MGRISRLLGALIRAALVVLVVALPAAMLPDASQSALEISLILGVMAGAFILFEYGSAQPGLIDFRFAPPYNRARFLTLATILVALIYLCRATEGTGTFAPGYLAAVDGLVAALDFPFSPVRLAPALIVGPGDPALALLVQRAAGLSLTIALAALAFFVLLLWLFRWPQGREKFNLWVNLPTFEPSAGRSVERRLLWRGGLYAVVGLTLPFTLTVLSSRALGWLDPSALGSYRTLVWGMTAWAILPAVFVIRGAALIKIGWLVRRARAYG